MSVISMYSKFGASRTKIDRGRHQKSTIWKEMRSAIMLYENIDALRYGIHNRHKYIHSIVVLQLQLAKWKVTPPP